jgi:hypothetical protein
MCNFDELSSVLAKSGTTLFMALIVAVIGVGTPVSDVVAQVQMQTPDMQTPDMQTPDMQTPDMQTPDMQGFDATEINPTEVKPTEIKPTEINPTEINATEIKPTEINATEIKPTEINATEINPTEINPTEVTPKQADIWVDNAQPPAPAAGAEAAGAGGGAGAGMGPAILVGGAAAAAGVAAIALGGLSTSDSGVDCGAAPQGFGGAWWSQYASWCECMGRVPDVNTISCTSSVFFLHWGRVSPVPGNQLTCHRRLITH